MSDDELLLAKCAECEGDLFCGLPLGFDFTDNEIKHLECLTLDFLTPIWEADDVN